MLPREHWPTASSSICSFKRLQKLLIKIKIMLLHPYPLMCFACLSMAFYKCYRHPNLRTVGLTHLSCSPWHPVGRNPVTSHRQAGTLLTFLPQNCHFDFGTSHHLSGFPSQILSVLSVHSIGSCRR